MRLETILVPLVAVEDFVELPDAKNALSYGETLLERRKKINRRTAIEHLFPREFN